MSTRQWFADGYLRVRLDDLCTVAVAAMTIGSFFAIGLWCLLIQAAYFMGGLSFAVFEAAQDSRQRV